MIKKRKEIKGSSSHKFKWVAINLENIKKTADIYKFTIKLIILRYRIANQRESNSLEIEY